MKKVTYPGHVPVVDLLGRVMGPDVNGAWSQIISVEHLDADPPTTRVTFRPVPPDAAGAMRDKHGRWWLPLPEEEVTRG